MGNVGSGPASGVEVPEKMRAVRLLKYVEKHSGDAADYSGYFETQEVDTPKPRAGQILVKVERSPINPSDLSHLTGTYNAAQREPCPCACGFEASGTVVASGGGYGYMLLGKRVGIVSKGGGRMWSEYAVATAMEAIVLPDEASFEQGSSLFVNPLTAIAFSEIIAAGKHKTVVLTASASALAKMCIRLFAQTGVRVVSVVRKASQEKELLEIGAAAVIVTSADGWEQKLKDVCKELDARICFDAVSGGLTGTVLHAMPPKSTVHVYGGLSLSDVSNVNTSDLIFAGKNVTGFWLTGYMKTKSMMNLAGWMKKVQRNIVGPLGTDVRRSYPMDKVADALADYNSNMANGKICIGPPLEEPTDEAVGRAAAAAEKAGGGEQGQQDGDAEEEKKE